MTTFLLGAMAMGCAVVALFFFRFYRDTRDRLFLYFGLSFLIEAANRTQFALIEAREDAPIYYAVRLVAYLLILWAVLEKNLPRRRN
jgi:hypothetical protein